MASRVWYHEYLPGLVSIFLASLFFIDSLLPASRRYVIIHL